MHSFSFEDPFLRRWIRRTFTVSLVLTVSVMYLLLFPLTLGMSLIADGLKRNRLSSIRALLFFGIFLLSEFHGVGGAIVLWLRYRLLRLGNKERYIEANYRLQWAWASFMVRATLWIFKMQLKVEDDPKDGRGPVLIFMQHASIADTLLPIYLLSRPFELSLRYVLKKELLWDPSIDVVGQRLPNVFVDRQGKQRSKQIRQLHAMASSLGPKDAAFIYPEGTRQTPKKRERILLSLQKTGNEEQIAYAKSLQHLLPPQMGGSIALLNAAPGTDVLFCAHIGLEGSTRIKDVWKGMLIGKTIHMKFWRVDGADVPTAPPARRKWFLQKWSEMDRWLSEQHAASLHG